LALPEASRQKSCKVHYSRNLLVTVGASTRKEPVVDLRVTFAAPAREQDFGSASTVAERWRSWSDEGSYLKEITEPSGLDPA
jgi:hypothetical protein